jgi:hypothetical protein
MIAHIHVIAAKSEAEEKEAIDIMDEYMFSYIGIKFNEKIRLDRPIRIAWKIECLDDTFCEQFLRFRKPDLGRLYTVVGLPPKVILDNGSRMSGEELFIRGLYELATGHKKTSIAYVFGRHYSDQSRALAYFVNHLYSQFHHLVDNNLAWWFDNGHIATSAQLIEERMNLSSRNKNVYAMFIDCNCLETSRPGGGPAEEGANSARWDPDLRSYYNGWKSVHGLKHQTVDSAYGMTVDIFGPTSLTRNDITLLRESNINQRVKIACTGQEYDFCIFGDSAYKVDTHLRSYITNATSEEEKRWNGAMKHVRISIEWNYMTSAALFQYIKEIRYIHKYFQKTVAFLARIKLCQQPNFCQNSDTNVAFESQLLVHQYVPQLNLDSFGVAGHNQRRSHRS